MTRENTANQSTDSTGGSITSASVGWEMVLNGT